MPDAATLTHATKVVGSVSPGQRADAALRAYFERQRQLPAALKRAISRAVFVHYRWLLWLDPKAPLPKRLEQADALQARFDANPQAIKAEALAALAVPPWVWDELSLADPAARAAYLRQLQREPALWLRARPGMAASLARSLFAAELAAPIPYRETDAVRFTGTQDLFKTEQFKLGEFEIQDLSSQLVGTACAPAPGETWWDACAGEGGKTLHLADLMRNKGLIWASDRHTGRLETLKRRAARARVFNYRTAPWDGGPKLPTKTRFDGVLVDAPCSGVGTWQRNPHARWTTTPDDVRELAAAQAALLGHIAPSLKPGGRLVYAVCTLTRSETSAVAEGFSQAHPEFEPTPVFTPTAKPSAPPARTAGESASSHLPPPASGPGPESSAVLWPHEVNANGMFIAAWRRR